MCDLRYMRIPSQYRLSPLRDYALRIGSLMRRSFDLYNSNDCCWRARLLSVEVPPVSSSEAESAPYVPPISICRLDHESPEPTTATAITSPSLKLSQRCESTVGAPAAD